MTPKRILAAVLAAIPLGTATVAMQNKPRADNCVTLSSAGHLNGGQSVRFPIPANLEVRILGVTQRDNVNEWNISVGPRDMNDDFMSIVSPPWHFNAYLTIGPAYGLSARENLQLQRQFRFVLTKNDLERALSIQQHFDNDNDIKELERIGRGTLRIEIEDARLSNTDPNVIEWIQFTGRACVPAP